MEDSFWLHDEYRRQAGGRKGKGIEGKDVDLAARDDCKGGWNEGGETHRKERRRRRVEDCQQ